jgi:hypothetical protein
MGEAADDEVPNIEEAAGQQVGLTDDFIREIR